MNNLSPTQLALAEAMAKQVLDANKGLYILPMYISGVVDTLLMGITIMQAVKYWRFVKHDRKHIVASVAIAVISASAATVALTRWLVKLFVWSFGNYLAFGQLSRDPREGILVVQSIGMITTVSVQSFYADRACRLFRHWWPAVVIGPFILAEVVGISVLFPYYKRTYEEWGEDSSEDPSIRIMTYILLSANLITDILITGIVVWGLYRVRTGWSHTDHVLRRLIVHSLEAQTPALILAISTLITWEVRFQVSVPCFILQSKIYVLGQLLTLNLRAKSNLNSAVSPPTGVSYSSDAARRVTGPPKSNLGEWYSICSNRQDAQRSANEKVGSASHDLGSAEHDIVDAQSQHDYAYGSTRALTSVNRQ